MTVKFKFDLTKYDSEFLSAALDRVESAADVIRDSARVRLKASIAAARSNPPPSLAGERWREHGPYKGGAPWTARYHREMQNTIRTTRSKDPTVKNIWVMAGQFLHWWALQLEYGHGGWKGGPKPFFRPALKESMGSVINILEGGGGPRMVK